MQKVGVKAALRKTAAERAVKDVCMICRNGIDEIIALKSNIEKLRGFANDILNYDDWMITLESVEIIALERGLFQSEGMLIKPTKLLTGDEYDTKI